MFDKKWKNKSDNIIYWLKEIKKNNNEYNNDLWKNISKIEDEIKKVNSSCLKIRNKIWCENIKIEKGDNIIKHITDIEKANKKIGKVLSNKDTTKRKYLVIGIILFILIDILPIIAFIIWIFFWNEYLKLYLDKVLLLYSSVMFSYFMWKTLDLIKNDENYWPQLTSSILMIIFIILIFIWIAWIK